MTFDRQIIFHNLDQWLAILGTVGSLLLIAYLALTTGRIVYVLTGVLTLIACLGWLAIRNHAYLPPQAPSSPLMQKYLSAVFFSFLTTAIILWYARPDEYSRPDLFMLFVAMMAAIVAGQATIGEKKYAPHILAQVIIIGALLVLSQICLFPGVVGADPWWHQMFTGEIVRLGHIPSGYVYSKLPMFQLMVSAGWLLYGSDYATAVAFSTSAAQVIILPLIIYLLGAKVIGDVRVGLLAAVLLTLGNYVIYLSYWNTPTSLAFAYSMIILLLLLYLKSSHRTFSILTSVAFMAILAVTHTLTSAFQIVILITIVFVSLLHPSTTRRKFDPILPALLIILMTIVLYVWSQAGYVDYFLRLLTSGFTSENFATPRPELLSYLIDAPLAEQLVTNIGMLLFFSMALVGLLYLLKGGSKTYVTYATVAFVPLAISFSSLITGRSVLEDRWWFFSQVLLSIPLAIALLLLMGHGWRKFVLSGVTATLAFLLIISPVANVDNHTFCEHLGVRYAVTVSELQAPATLSKLTDRALGGDEYYSSSVMQWLGYRTVTVDRQLLDADFRENSNKQVVLIREEVRSEPVKIFYAPYKLKYDPAILLERQGFMKIYSSSNVGAYMVM